MLSLPAIAEVDEEVPVWAGQIHRRKPGDVLSPEREPLWALEAQKLQMGGAAFSAQYQQTPVPPGGAMIKRHWLQRYSELPPAAERLLVLQSWDTASKGGPDNDWSVCTTWILTRKRAWYLIDVWRKRVDYPGLKAAVQSLARQWRAQRILIEDAGAGIAIVQELRGQVPGALIAVRPDRDKASRMSVASSKFEGGQIFFPGHAPWLADLEAELFSFPGGRHDDQCDSISQALLDSALPFWSHLTTEDWDRLLARSREPGPQRPRGW